MARFTPLQLGVAVAVAVSVAVSMVFTVVYMKISPPAQIPAPAPQQSKAAEALFGRPPPPECAVIQKKIDAAGWPGWDRLGPALQAEIQNAPPECIFMGDGKAY